MINTQKIRRFASSNIKNAALELDPPNGHLNYCRFIILGKGRSGSNFLRGLLNSQSQTIAFGELFRDYDSIGWEFPEYNQYLQSPSLIQAMQNDPRNFIKDSVFRKYPEPIKAVGFKLFYYHARNDSRQGLWDFLQEEKNIKVIHLKRNNTLREILSLKKAFKTNRWTNVTGQVEEPFSIRLDYEDCLQEFKYAQEIKQQYDHFFQEHPMLHVSYEELSCSYRTEVGRVQEFLEVNPEPVKPSTYKQSSQSLAEAIVNYSELKQSFQGTPWSAFFED